MRIVPVLLLAWLVVGCAQTRTYQVSVANHTSEPITFGLVKEGEPFERQWESPEDAAINEEHPNSAMWDTIAPGRTAVSNPVQGKFARGAVAVLRVYLGKLTLPEILAVSRGQPNRIDVPLHPGMNAFHVTDESGHFTATPADRPAGQAAAAQ